MTVKVWQLKENEGLILISQTIWNMYVFAVTFRNTHSIYIGGIEDTIYKVNVWNNQE